MCFHRHARRGYPPTATGQSDPHDPERPTRTFTLWLSDGAGHLPLRLEVPIGLGDVVITLTGSRKLALAPAVRDQVTPAAPNDSSTQ